MATWIRSSSLSSQRQKGSSGSLPKAPRPLPRPTFVRTRTPNQARGSWNPNRKAGDMKFIDGIPVWGSPDPGAISQIKTCALTADKVALMADHHKGYAVPIGGVVAYKDAISPSGVGYDIACGNIAVLVNMPGEELRLNIERIMDEVCDTVSFGVGRRNNER